MPRKLIDVFTALPLLIASLCGGLIFLAAFAGHPPEWILDAYYSIFPATAVAGVMALFAFIGLLSLWLFGFAMVRIFRRAPTAESTGGMSTKNDAPNSRKGP
jgi:hypothetical protein